MAYNSFRQDEELKTSGKRTTMRRLFRYLLDYKFKILMVLLIMAYCIGVSILNPLIFERAIDVHIKNHDIYGLIRLITSAFILNIIMVFLIKLRMYIMAKICNQVLTAYNGS